jgi:hypothetical protein
VSLSWSLPIFLTFWLVLNPVQHKWERQDFYGIYTGGPHSRARSSNICQGQMRQLYPYLQMLICSVNLNRYYSHWLIMWLWLIQVNYSVRLSRRIQKHTTLRNQLHFMIMQSAINWFLQFHAIRYFFISDQKQKVKSIFGHA